MPEKRCAACQAPFQCGAGEPGCWCQDLPPLEPIPGRDCLCRECLEKALKKNYFDGSALVRR